MGPDTFVLDRWLARVRLAVRGIGVLLLVVLIAMPAVQVVLREWFRAPFIGAEELTRFMLICVVMVAVPYTIASGASVRMEEFAHALPAAVQRWLSMLIATTGAVAFGVAAVSVAVATLRNLANATPTLGIPYWIFFSAALVGFALAAIEFLIILAKAWLRRPLYVTIDAEQPPDLPDFAGER
jgi:TRAP-type C4-dicarboxylate transport system permease small subunit